MAIPATGPTLVPKKTVEFKYPYNSPYTYELQLPRVKSQDDIWRLGLTRASNQTRNKDVKLFRDPDWPKENTLLWTLTDLTYTEIAALRVFMSNTLGKPLKVIDWYTQTWEAIITNTTDDQTEDADNTNCGQRYTANLQLSAELKSWP